jgi:hypothetical protein
MQKIIHSGYNVGYYEHSKFKELMTHIGAENLCDYSEQHRFDISIWLLDNTIINYKHFHHLNPPTTIYLHGDKTTFSSIETKISEALLKYA